MYVILQFLRWFMDVQVIQNSRSQSVSVAANSTALDLATSLKLTAPNEALCCLINGQLCDMSTPLHQNDTVEILSFDHPKGKEVFWHTATHVLAQAVVRLWPEAHPTIGPAIEEGFYHDFANLTISDEDFPRIEEEMQRIIKENYKPERKIFASPKEMSSLLKGNPYREELVQEFASAGSQLVGYQQGEYFSPCLGPHLPSLGKIKAFKILKTSGAYWRGDATKAMLTRIYGIAYPDKKQLQEYLYRIEEAKKRDHKVLGPKLDLFSLHEEAPGIPFIHAKGMVVWNRILEYWRECHRRAGYVEVKTPSMMVKTLWERSGHWQNYRANMFTSVIEDREFAIKPMNCPGGMVLFKSQGHSYRDLPMRVAEVGQVHRYEASGALSGLFRVRSFHQDDAHIFMRPEDIQGEILGCLNLLHEIYSTFGLTYKLVLSTRPKENTIGSDSDWELTTTALRKALEATGKPFSIAEGDGAFYGPKIDIHVFDALGRTWQCGTVQLDMSLPERFELEYTDADGTKKRPIMAHRALLGSIERFFGNLIEFYAGKFPLWLSPSQVAVLPVADRHLDYANKVKKIFFDAGFEAKVDDSSESVSKKVRTAQLEQYNYILTVGDKELEENNVSVRTRDNVVHGQMAIDALLDLLCKERQQKSLSSPLS
jgi:threonyl-tRNA synthetase